MPLLESAPPSAWAGGFALSIVMLPLVSRTTMEVLALVPNHLREASYALGVAKWRTVISVVLPTAIGGIMTGTTLAVARAAGETAPLLFVCAATTRRRLESEGAQLDPVHDLRRLRPEARGQAQAWGAAFTLIFLVLVLSLTSRYFLDRSKRKRADRFVGRAAAQAFTSSSPDATARLPTRHSVSGRLDAHRSRDANRPRKTC